jgi:hypothetical protein
LKGIRWNGAKSEGEISWDGLTASVKYQWPSDWQYVFVNKGFVISEAYSRKGNFPGTIVYYFEVTQIATVTGMRKFISKFIQKKVKLLFFS